MPTQNGRDKNIIWVEDSYKYIVRLSEKDGDDDSDDDNDEWQLQR